MIAADSQEMVSRRRSDRSECESRDCHEVRHRRRRMMVARVEGAIVNVRVVWWRERLDGEVRGSSSWERSREYVRNEVVGSQDNREIKGVLLEEEVPADDFGGLRMADEHKIPMIRMHNKVGSF